MASSVTGGGLVYSYNTFLQRGLNLLDIQDAGTARANLGLSGTITWGPGLVSTSGSYTPTSSTTVSVNSSTIGTPSTIAAYDASGNFTTGGTLMNIGFGSTPAASTLNFNCGTGNPLASITRGTGANGALSIQNQGTGLIQLTTGGAIQFTTATSGTVTTQQGLNVGLGAGSSSLSALAITGGLSVDAISGSGISDSTTGTSSTIAGSTKAVATVATSAAARLPLAGGTLTGPLTIASGQSLALSGVTVSGNPSFSGGATVTSGQTLALDGVTISGNPSFSGKPAFPARPSFCYRTPADVSTVNAGVNYDQAVDFNTGVFVPARGCSLSGTSTIAIGNGNAGRYAITISGKVSGNGVVTLFVNGNIPYYLWNGATSTTENISQTFLLDLALIDTLYVSYRSNTQGTAFTVSSGFTISGYQI